MTKTLTVRTSVHGQHLSAFFFGNVFFPERGSALGQHAAPVILHFFHYLVLLAQHTKRFQFVETHIRRGDFQNIIVEDNRFYHSVFLFLVEEIVHDGKHIGITEHFLALLAIHAIVYQSLLFFVPESGNQLGFQSVGQSLVFVGIVGLVDGAGNGGHRFQRLAE